jgi:hypothetical protein
MPARITVYLMMNDEQFNATKDSAIAGADLMGTHIGGAAKKGAKDAEGAMQNLSHKMGSIFSSIGSGAASMGLPFASTFSKMGSQLSATTGKAEGLKMMMASIGKISLGVGIAGIAAGAVEGVKLWDSYEKSLVSVQTVAKNTGANMGEFSAQLGKAQASAAKLGFANTDVNQSMANITMATGSSKKAFADLGMVEDLARYKNVSLGAAADALDHVFGGSTRTLLSWGININVASGRLHSLQMMHEAVSKAELAVTTVEQKHSAGMLEGVAYTTAYASAQLQLKDAQTNLAVGMGTINKVLEVLRDRTKGSADAFSKTFAGQLAATRAEMHNFGTDVGKDVVNTIEHLEIVISKIIGFFEHFRMVALGVAAVIVGPIVASIGIYLLGAFQRFGTQLLTVGGRFNTFGLNSRTAAGASDALQASIDALTAAIQQTGEQAIIFDDDITSLTEEMYVTDDMVDALVISIQTLGTDAELTAGKVATIGPSFALMSEEAVPAIDAVGVSLKGMLGPLGMVIAGLSAALLFFGEVEQASQREILDSSTNALKGSQLYYQGIGTGNMAAAKTGIQQMIAEEGKGQYGMVRNPAYKDPKGLTGLQYEANQKPWDKQLKQEVADYKAGTKLPKMIESANLKTLKHEVKIDEKQWNYLASNSDARTKAEKEWAKGHPDSLDNPYTKASIAAAKEAALLAAEEKAGYTPPKTGGGIPGGSGYKENPILAAGLTFLQKMQTNLETGTIQSLQPQLKSTSGKERYTQELETVTAAIGPIKDGVLTATQTSLTNLRTDLVNTHKKELDLWNALEKNQQQIAYADWLTAADTQYKDQTTIIADMSTKLVQSITDSTAVSASLATKKADLYTDQATTAADILGERGLYGLNLITQRMKVSLDQMTTGYQKREDAASVVVAQTTKHGDAAINAAKLVVDRMQKKTDIPIAKEQKFSDIMAAGGSTIQQAAAASGLKVGQAYQALLLDRANRGLTIAQDAANRANANAAKSLSAIQNAAKVAEAKQNALIAVEQARANTEFAGSGVHIEITGIQPTDAAAVASSVSWAMRTKVPR